MNPPMLDSRTQCGTLMAPPKFRSLQGATSILHASVVYTCSDNAALAARTTVPAPHLSRAGASADWRDAARCGIVLLDKALAHARCALARRSWA